MVTIDPTAITDLVTMDGFEGRYLEAGTWTVGFETFQTDEDPAPLFVGLPDDACQCQHLGYVIEGSLTYTYADGRSETIEAGQAYVVQPGHLPVFHAGSRIVEFSPTEQFAATVAVIEANLHALAQS